MKLYDKKKNVYEASLERIERLYAAFPNVVVAISGGKDSTVVFNLAMRVAEKMDRLPLSVLWLDQEAEWQAVVDYNRSIMSDPRVRPIWFQGPFRLYNATTSQNEQPWLNCWAPGETWMRPQEPNSIHDNPTKIDRFGALFNELIAHYFNGEPVAGLGGVRCEESPSRQVGLTSYPTWQDITWGKKLNEARQQYMFYPIYDWSWTDVWHAIHTNQWTYCSLYDKFYQLGYPVGTMRVSSVHHETAVGHLRRLQEIEPQTWAALIRRIPSVNAVKQAWGGYTTIQELPKPFTSWRRFRDHLLYNLVADPEKVIAFEKRFLYDDDLFVMEDSKIAKHVHIAQITCILVNDYECVKMANFQNCHIRYRRQQRQRRDQYTNKTPRITLTHEEDQSHE